MSATLTDHVGITKVEGSKEYNSIYIRSGHLNRIGLLTVSSGIAVPAGTAFLYRYGTVNRLTAFLRVSSTKTAGWTSLFTLSKAAGQLAGTRELFPLIATPGTVVSIVALGSGAAACSASGSTDLIAGTSVGLTLTEATPNTFLTNLQNAPVKMAYDGTDVCTISILLPNAVQANATTTTAQLFIDISWNSGINGNAEVL